MLNLAVGLGYPLLVVARAGLGTINHTLLTVEAARSRGLTVAGVILNEAEPLAETLELTRMRWKSPAEPTSACWGR